MPALNKFEFWFVINTNLSFISHNILIHWWKVCSFGSFEVLPSNCNFKIMEILSSEDLKVWLSCLVWNAISNFWSKHKLRTLHEIVHHIFQRWFQSFFVNEIEIYFLVCGYLDSNITFDVVNLSSHVIEGVVIHPMASFFINLKKQNWARWSCD